MKVSDIVNPIRDALDGYEDEKLTRLEAKAKLIAAGNSPQDAEKMLAQREKTMAARVAKRLEIRD